MKNIIAIILIIFGAYFVYDAGKTIYNVSRTTDNLEYSSDGEYQEIVTYEDITDSKNTQTYTFLFIGIVFIAGGGALLYFSKRKH